MVTTMTPPPGTRSKPRSVKRPVQKRKVPITVKPSAEDRAQLRRDRISAVIALLFIIAMVALVIWAALTGDISDTGAMWDSPYLY